VDGNQIALTTKYPDGKERTTKATIKTLTDEELVFRTEQGVEEKFKRRK
jgi:hypothetical protein